MSAAAKKNKKKRAAKLKENGGAGGAGGSEPAQLQPQPQDPAADERQRRACTIKLDNVDYSLREEDLHQAAEAFGSVSAMAFSKGFAFVELASADEATAVFKNMDGAVLGGRSIRALRYNPSMHGNDGARGRGGARGGRGRGRGDPRGGRGAGWRGGLAGTRSEETVNGGRGPGVPASRSNDALNVLAGDDRVSSAPEAADARTLEFQRMYQQVSGGSPSQPEQQPRTVAAAVRPGAGRPGIDLSNVVADHSSAFEYNSTWSSRAEHKYTPKQDDFPALGQERKSAPDEFPSLSSAIPPSGNRGGGGGGKPPPSPAQEAAPMLLQAPEPEPEPEPEPPVLDLAKWTEWNVEQVCAWLGGLNGLVGKEACIKAFADNSLNGPVLEELDDSMLKDDLGITALGDRLAVRRGIKALQAGGGERGIGSPASNRAEDSPSRGRSSSESKMIALLRTQPVNREGYDQMVVDADATDPLIVYTKLHLGEGAQGQVYEGAYQGRVCAVKRMSATERSSLRELDAYRSGRLRHPSLVHYQTCKMEHGLLYLAMDLCHTSLSTASPRAQVFLARLQRDLSLQRKLARQLMEGLTYLHSPEISMVHRDLKPSNVLVDISKEGVPRLLICDMGLSKRRDAAVSMSTLGDNVGTLGWMPPILHASPNDHRNAADLEANATSDVFSAGLVLFHLLSGGGHPFDLGPSDAPGSGGSSSSSNGGAENNGRRLAAERQARIAAWGLEWQEADVEERARHQSDFLEQLQAPRPMLPIEKGEPTDEKEKGSLTPRLGASFDEQQVLSPEAASLIAMMLYPDPSQRIQASQTLADPYFRLFELQAEDEIAEAKLPQPWRQLPGGRGAFGVVYKSTYQGLDVAVKRIITAGAQPKSLRFSISGDTARGSVEEDFCREVQLLRKLRHPCIVMFLGWCKMQHEKGGSDLCIVTELCTTSVEAILHGNQSGRYSTTMALSIAKDAAQGLAFLHEATPPVVHRDLKPGNLLVDRVGRVKICDFGLARVGAMTDGAGTPNYLAPEILLGEDAANTTSDVYSYGVVLHELFTRQRPFVEKLNLQPRLAQMQMTDHYQEGGSLLPIVGFPFTAGEALPERVAACLARQREKRPRFAELATSLDKIFRQFKLDQRAAKQRQAAAPAPAPEQSDPVPPAT